MSEFSNNMENEEIVQKLLNEAMAKRTLSPLFSLNKNHRMVNKVMEGIVVPPNLIQEIRDKSEVSFRYNKARRKSIVDNKINRWRNEWIEAEEAVYAMKMALLRPTGGPDPVLTNSELLDMQSKLGQIIPLPQKGF
jgi:hypothetical protein